MKKTQKRPFKVTDKKAKAEPDKLYEATVTISLRELFDTIDRVHDSGAEHGFNEATKAFQALISEGVIKVDKKKAKRYTKARAKKSKR